MRLPILLPIWLIRREQTSSSSPSSTLPLWTCRLPSRNLVNSENYDNHHFHHGNNDNDKDDDWWWGWGCWWPIWWWSLSAATRGTGVEGAVPADTLIIFAIGGWLPLILSFLPANALFFSFFATNANSVGKLSVKPGCQSLLKTRHLKPALNGQYNL